MPFGVSHWEIVILVLVLVLLFGPSQLPKLGRQLGRGAREARKEYADVKQSFELREAEPERRDEAETG